MKAAFASNLIKYLELMAGLTGTVCFYRKAKSVWLAFAVYLILLYGMEELGSWYGKNKMYAQNTSLYKWLVVPSLFTIYYFVFHSFTKKSATVLCGTIFILLALFENIFWSENHFYAISLSISFGCVSILFLSLVYFFQLLKSNSILDFKSQMPFWFSTGLLTFYLGCLPYLTFFNSIAISNERAFVEAYRWVFIILNYTMYILFTIGFICSKPKP
jgi:hypothetical protein